MSFCWPDPAPPDAPVRAALHRASAMVGIARGLVASGRTVDLTGLEALAGALCAQVLDLPPAQGAGFRPALAELAATVSALDEALRLRAEGRS